MEDEKAQNLYGLVGVIIIVFIVGFIIGKGFGASERQSYLESSVEDCLENDHSSKSQMIDCVYGAIIPPEPAPTEE